MTILILLLLLLLPLLLPPLLLLLLLLSPGRQGRQERQGWCTWRRRQDRTSR
jgi:hypothetical protein